MSIQYLTAIDLNQNELLNPRAQNLASAPGTPVAGQWYFDTGSNLLRYWDGSQWVDLSDTPTMPGVLTYLGDADASETDPDAATGTSSHAAGDTYRITTAGDTAFGFELAVGDFVVYNGTDWDKIDNTDPSVVGTTNRISVSQTGPNEYTVDVSSSYAGQATITTLGTIATGTWQATAIAVLYGGTGATTASGARANLGATGKYSALIGNGSATTITITQATHGLASNAQMHVALYSASSGAQVYCDVSIDNGNGTVTLTFATAPASNAYRVVIIG